MKSNWSENAAWQFIGVVLSALGIFISLLPENQRLWGFMVSMIGMLALSWTLLRKPVKRITQQLTPKRIPRSSQKPTYLTFQPSVRRKPIIVEEESDESNNKIFFATKKQQTILSIIIALGIAAVSAWELLLVNNYIESIWPSDQLLGWSLAEDHSAQYTKLLNAYIELHNFFHSSLIIAFFCLAITNGYIGYIILEVIISLSKKLKQLIFPSV